MNCLISCFNKFFIFLAALLIITAAGCAGHKQPVEEGMQIDSSGQMDSAPAGSPGILPAADNILIAFLPLENLSATRAPLKEIGASFRKALLRKGFRLLDEEPLEKFRKKYRMRYTGGISSELGEALQKELQVDAILITSLEAYQERKPPQISLISRLVTSGRQPEIVWMDSIGLSGDQSPGLLDLTRIKEPQPLLVKAVDELAVSLVNHFNREIIVDESFLPTIPESWKASGPGTLTSPRYRLNRKYLPYDYFRSSLIDPEKRYSIAVIPLLDIAVRKNAGMIVSLHYVKALVNLTDYKVFEPGLVREELLRFRAIMPAGPSLAISDLITSEGSLGVDLVLSGKVFDYQNRSTEPQVDFSMQVIEKNTREVVFGARSFSSGMDGVFFFNFGRVFTAHDLVKEMVKITVQLLKKPYLPWEPEESYIAGNRFRKGDEHVDNSAAFVVTDTSRADKFF